MVKILRRGDLGTPERHIRGEVVQEVVNDTLVAINRKPTSYHPMLRRKLITPEQFYAADQLRTDYDIGVIGYTSYEVRERTSGGVYIGKTEREIHHRQKYYKALDSLNTMQKTIIARVIINDGTPTARHQSRTEQRQKMKLFKQALDALAKYYG